MKYIKKYPLLSALLIAVVLFIGAGFMMGAFIDDSTTSVIESSAINPGPTGAYISNEAGTQLNYVGVVGASALDELRQGAEIETESFDFGEFVTSINGVSSTDGENFWALYVNGQQATVGAGDYVAEEGDAIEWRLEDIEF